MTDALSSSPTRRAPWNKGKIIGARPPLRPRHVWSIRTKLQVEGRIRDLALFNLAIDSKLRGCDLVSLKVDDVAPNGYAADRATIRQKKTGRPVKFELTETTRQAVDDYLKTKGRTSGFLFVGRRKPDGSLTTRQYARLLADWLASIGLDPHMWDAEQRRPSYTGALAIYGPSSCCWDTQKIESTVRYLDIEADDALAIAEQVDVWTQHDRQRAYGGEPKRHLRS